MRKNGRKRLNCLMVVFMIIVTSYQAVGNLFHEAAGVILFILFMVHNILNRKWYQNIAKGKYSVYRKIILAVDLLTLVCMLVTMGTGIYLSQSIFAPLFGMREAYLIRPYHVAAGAWGVILVSIHGGMHITISNERKISYLIGVVLLIAAGIYACIILDMPNRLFLKDMGAYWGYSGILLFAANAVVMAFFTAVSATVTKKIKNEDSKRR